MIYMSIDSAVKDYRSGMAMRNVLEKYPDVKRSTVYRHLKTRNPVEQPQKPVEQPQKPVEQPQKPAEQPQKPVEQPQKPVEQPQKQVIAPPPPQQNRQQRQPVMRASVNSDTAKVKPGMSSVMGSDFSDLFSKMDNESHNPSNIMKPAQTESAEKPPTKTEMKQFFKLPKMSKKEKTPEEEEQDLDTQRFKVIYQIRLYLYNFDLDDLHIVKPNRDKFLIGLYTKKLPELEKTLHFLKFHVRHSNTKVSGLFENMFYLSTKVLENTTCAVGMKTQGLTQSMKEDDEVKDIIKEISIELQASKPYFGPKTDLAIKLLSKVGQIDAHNRITDAGNEPNKKAEEEKVKLSTEEINEELQEKYSDL